MKKEYFAPEIEAIILPNLMQTMPVSKGGDPVDDPNKVESQRFWGGSIFDDTDEEEETFF